MSKACALPKSLFPVKFKVKSPVHALELAKELIRPFRHWTTGALAVAHIDSGIEVAPKSAKAEAFCALGALQRVNTKHGRRAQKFLEQAACIMKGDCLESACDLDIFDINDFERDKTTHRAVLKMFTKAIRLAKQDVLKR
jgi:hypothetical protein